MQPVTDEAEPVDDHALVKLLVLAAAVVICVLSLWWLGSTTTSTSPSTSTGTTSTTTVEVPEPVTIWYFDEWDRRWECMLPDDSHGGPCLYDEPPFGGKPPPEVAA